MPKKQRELLVAVQIILFSLPLREAAAQVLPGKGSDFEAEAYEITSPALVAVVASRCGLRDETWRLHVTSALWRRVRALADRTWGPHNSPAYEEIVAFNELNERVGAAMQNTTPEDCGTLKGEPKALAKLDALAASDGTDSRRAWEYAK